MSDFYNKYPYTDFHELNLDWVIERVKKLTEDWLATHEEWVGVQQDWADTEQAWIDFKAYVENYLANLDVQDEIDHKIDQMVADGSLRELIQPDVLAQTRSTTTEWLSTHITQPSTPAVDTSLSVLSAAADAAITGTKINNLDSDIHALISNGYTVNRLNYVHGRIAGAPGTIFSNPFTWRSTSGIKFNNNGNALLHVPAGAGVTLWRSDNADITIGTLITVGSYTSDTTVSVTTAYWYVIVAYDATDPDGSLHITLPLTSLDQISMSYIDETGYFENRLDTDENDIAVIKKRFDYMDSELQAPYIAFTHGRIAGAGSFFNNPYSYRNNTGLYLKKGSILRFRYDPNNNLNIYGYSDAAHTTIIASFIVPNGSDVCQYQTVYDGYYHFCIENKTSPGAVLVTDAELNNFNCFVYNSDNLILENVKGYASQFITEEQQVIEKVQQLKTKDTLVFAVCTDVHGTNYPMEYTLPPGATPTGSKGYYRFKEFADLFTRLAEENAVAFMSNLGDTIASVYDESNDDHNHTENKKRFSEFSRRISRSFIPYLYTIGHHEMYRFNDDGITKDELIGMGSEFNRYFTPVYNSLDPDCAYYYIDMPEPFPAVRIISLDCCTNGSGNEYSLTEVGWLTNIALNTTRPVIVLSHVGTALNNSALGIAHGDDVENALNAFVSNGGTVLAFIHGHTHVDNIITPAASGNSYVDITSACSWCLKASINPNLIGNPQSWDRTYNTYSEFMIDFYCINCRSGKIDIIRFGAGNDRQYVP